MRPSYSLSWISEIRPALPIRRTLLTCIVGQIAVTLFSTDDNNAYRPIVPIESLRDCGCAKERNLWPCRHNRGYQLFNGFLS